MAADTAGAGGGFLHERLRVSAVGVTPPLMETVVLQALVLHPEASQDS